MHVRRNDTVEVITGDDSGKRGKILGVMPKEGRVIVEGVNLVFKHLRKSAQYPQGGRVRREAPFHLSNVMLVCPHCSKRMRPKRMVLGDGKRTRGCRECGAAIEAKV
ncbi:MAG: 50S ribosomal protein L24 [Planctomycetota bacterium]